MRDRREEVIHIGRWAGLGELYNVYTGSGYTTIVVREPETLHEKVRNTWAKFGYTPSGNAEPNLLAE